jgi:hypothetical protein
MKLKVGITLSGAPIDATQAMWANGMNQNAVFLHRLLAQLPDIGWAGFAVSPDVSQAPAVSAMFGIPWKPLSACVDQVDVLIEMGIRSSADDMRRFRARGGKLVSYVAGNAMVMNLEAVANKTPYGEILNHAGYDAIWITPQHWRTNHAYMRLTRGGPVVEAPHIWSPEIGDRLRLIFGRPFEPRRKPPFRIGVFEPTINVVKTFHLPLLVCEEAYRARPDLIDRVLLFGALPLKDTQHFVDFTAGLDLAKAGKVFAEDRHPLHGVLGEHVDAVVTHQWENELNYLYWDVLSAGLPLVHNSAAIRDAGAYFPAFDPQAGAQALIRSLDTVDGPPTPTEADNAAVWRYNLANPGVQERYGALLRQLMTGAHELRVV